MAGSFPNLAWNGIGMEELRDSPVFGALPPVWDIPLVSSKAYRWAQMHPAYNCLPHFLTPHMGEGICCIIVIWGPHRPASFVGPVRCYYNDLKHVWGFAFHFMRLGLSKINALQGLLLHIQHSNDKKVHGKALFLEGRSPIMSS